MKIIDLPGIFEFYSIFYTDTYSSFKDAYDSAISGNCELTKPRTVSDAVILKALNTVLKSIEVPPPVKYLLDKYCSRIISYLQSNKITNKLQKLPSGSSPSPMKDRPKVVSNTKTKLVKRQLQGLEIIYPSVCKMSNCPICKQAARDSPLTMCTHPFTDTHPHRVFPHISRSELLARHVRVANLEDFSEPAPMQVEPEKPVQAVLVDTPPVEEPETEVVLVVQPETRKTPKGRKKKATSIPNLSGHEAALDMDACRPQSPEDHEKFVLWLMGTCGCRDKAIAFLEGLGYQRNITVDRLLERMFGPIQRPKRN